MPVFTALKTSRYDILPRIMTYLHPKDGKAWEKHV